MSRPTCFHTEQDDTGLIPNGGFFDGFVGGFVGGLVGGFVVVFVGGLVVKPVKVLRCSFASSFLASGSFSCNSRASIASPRSLFVDAGDGVKYIDGFTDAKVEAIQKEKKGDKGKTNR